MIYFSIVFIGLLVIAFVNGMSDCETIDVFIEIKRIKSPYYTIGISFNPDVDEIYDEFMIGLFFINIVIVFYKNQE